jgi:chromosomal replication initiation ATPase DnaA
MISPYVFPMLKDTKIPKPPYQKKNMHYIKKKNKASKERMIEIIAEVYEVDKNFHMIRKRNKHLVDARRVLCKLLVNQYGWTKVAIAKFLNKNHTSVIHCIDSFDNLYQTDDTFRDNADEVFERLQTSR